MSEKNPSRYDTALDYYARMVILDALYGAEQNRTHAARALGIPHRRLMREINRLDLCDEVGIAMPPTLAPTLTEEEANAPTQREPFYAAEGANAT